MVNSTTGQTETEHTTNPVPFIVVANSLNGNHTIINNGILPDIASTVLCALNLTPPPEMTGKNLLADLPL